MTTLIDEASLHKGTVIAVTGDVTVDAWQRNLVETVTERFKGLDAAFSNAGILGELAPIEQVSDKGWCQTLNTNLTSAMLAAQA